MPPRFNQDDYPARLFFEPRPDQPDRYDQQTAFCESRTRGVKLIIGGNGSGTTTTALHAVVDFLYTTPPPRKDTPFWIISNTYEMAMGTCWVEKLHGMGLLLNDDIQWDRINWYRSNSSWPYSVPLKPYPGTGKNWCLWFKSYEQGRQRMQAQSIGGFLFVEQFPWGLLQEVLRGCREYNLPGSKMCEFTPVDPNLSIEIEEMETNDNLPTGWEIYRANTECAMEAGNVDEAWYHEFFGTIADEMVDTRKFGKWASYEGAIYKGFNPAVHLVGDDVIDLPPNIHHRRGIDWGAGLENPFCCLFAYKNGLGQWYVYDEYYSNDQLKTSVDHLCEVVDMWPWPDHNPHYGTTYADPSSPDSMRIASKLSQYTDDQYDGISMQGANNSVLEGIEHVQWMLKPTVRKVDVITGEIRYEPRLFIHKENCPNLARQMRTYRWKKGTEAGRNPQDARREPLKLNDHAVDACRYLVFTEAASTGSIPSAIKREDNSRKRGIHLQR